MKNFFKSIISFLITILLTLTIVMMVSFAFDHVAMHLRDKSFEETKIKALTNTGEIDLLVDLETNVMYVRTATGTLTAMLNADGSPKLYTHEYK